VDRRLVNVCGVNPDPATLAQSERLVAGFVRQAMEGGSDDMAAGAALALLCFCSPLSMTEHLHKQEGSMQEFVDAGMSEVEDILASTEVAVRLSALTKGMRDKQVRALMKRAALKGEGTRTAALRSTEEMVMELMAE
jgi:hypothetical protein